LSFPDSIPFIFGVTVGLAPNTTATGDVIHTLPHQPDLLALSESYDS
jgi:hypothetical protein